MLSIWVNQRNKAFFVLTTIFAISLAGTSHAAEQVGSTGEALGASIAGFLGPISAVLADFVFKEFAVGDLLIPWIVVWMAIPMFFLTVYFGFINFRSFGIAKKILTGRYWDEKAEGEVSQFQALTTALSGTVGIGNIAGVAVAIGTGGPGATFWMIIIGLAAMSVKFAECTLGVKYREVHEDGTISGGPMYYLKNGLKNRGLKKLGIALSISYVVFALPAILQWATVNQIHSQLSSATGLFAGNGLGFGIVLAVLVGAVILGGLHSIAAVTSKLVPAMVIVYLGAALVVLISNFSAIPAAFLTIFEHAFNPQAVGGGIIGVIIIGMRRAVYSTEAGLGTSSMVHAAAKTKEPVSEGMVGLMEPFIDTVMVSTITALVIVVSGAWQIDGLNDIQLTSKAFETTISWFPWVLSLAVFLFGFSTIISWAYYIEKVWEYIFGDSNISIKTYRLIYVLLLIPGAVLTAAQVFDIIDSLFFLMAIPNIIGLYILAPEIKADLKSYLARLKSGEIKETNPS